MSRALLFVPLFLFVALVGYFAVGLTRNPNEIPSVLIDKPLPPIDLPVPGREDVRFQTATLSGKVSLLNVFASWCIACRVEHPVLLKLTAAKEIPVY